MIEIRSIKDLQMSLGLHLGCHSHHFRDELIEKSFENRAFHVRYAWVFLNDGFLEALLTG